MNPEDYWSKYVNEASRLLCSSDKEWNMIYEEYHSEKAIDADIIEEIVEEVKEIEENSEIDIFALQNILG